MNRLEIIATFPTYLEMLREGKTDRLQEIIEDTLNEAYGKEVYKNGIKQKKKTEPKENS